MGANIKKQNNVILRAWTVWIWGMCMIFGWCGLGILPADAQPKKTDASISWLTSSFFAKPPAHQKQALRQLTLFSSNDALLFFCRVALDQRVDIDVRRDALKSILAMDSTRYRAAYMPLSKPGLSNQAVIEALELLPIEGIGHAWLASIDWKNDTQSEIAQKLTQGYRSLQDVQAIAVSDVDTWDKATAASGLKKEIKRSKVDLEPFLLGLMGWVAGPSDTSLFRAKLTHPVLEVRQAAVYGLTRPQGPRSYKAIVAALQKESKSELPVQMIEYLVQDGSQQAKEAAQQFAKQLPAKEKAWVLAQWP